MSVARAKAEINAREFAQWKAFYRIEPFGERRQDLRIALMTYHLVCAQATSECAEKLKVSDFMLDFAPKEPVSEEQTGEQTDEQIAAIVNNIAACLGGF